MLIDCCPAHLNKRTEWITSNIQLKFSSKYNINALIKS
jgi:hypothetical protein